ncbi:MAG: gas vesicle protein GvpJ [Chloroflexota bacterium]
MLRVREREATLLDLLDRLLDKGVVVAGELTLSVAEVDLIFASLRLVVTSVDKIREVQGGPSPDWRPHPSPGNGGGPGAGSGPPEDQVGEAGLAHPGREQEVSPEFTSSPSGVADIDPEKTADGIARLVLTLAELIRRLLERETLRRMERGTLTPQETERLGRAFRLMEQKMHQMRETFHLKEEDLGLDLGPLGRLM